MRYNIIYMILIHLEIQCQIPGKVDGSRTKCYTSTYALPTIYLEKHGKN